MSAQDVVKFAEKIAGDEALRNQIKSLTPGDSNSLMKIATGLGFSFTTEELKSVAVDHAGELTDEQLDHVAGGIIAVTPPPATNHILIGLLLPAVQAPGGIIAPTDFHK